MLYGRRTLQPGLIYLPGGGRVPWRRLDLDSRTPYRDPNNLISLPPADNATTMVNNGNAGQGPGASAIWDFGPLLSTVTGKPLQPDETWAMFFAINVSTAPGSTSTQNRSIGITDDINFGGGVQYTAGGLKYTSGTGPNRLRLASTGFGVGGSDAGTTGCWAAITNTPGTSGGMEMAIYNWDGTNVSNRLDMGLSFPNPANPLKLYVGHGRSNTTDAGTWDGTQWYAATSGLVQQIPF